MKPKSHNQLTAPPEAGPLESAGLSLMAVQELLGLFKGHQEHARRAITDQTPDAFLQHALQDKPLTYI
jgi:hypothetical protein